jgi:hypothetical protein
VAKAKVAETKMDAFDKALEDYFSRQ